MSALSACFDDELIAEVQRRLGAGRFGHSGLCSPRQLDVAAAWSRMVAEINQLSLERPEDPVVVRLRTLAHELAD